MVWATKGKEAGRLLNCGRCQAVLCILGVSDILKPRKPSGFGNRDCGNIVLCAIMKGVKP
jgi:hypothetical protein